MNQTTKHSEALRNTPWWIWITLATILLVLLGLALGTIRALGFVWSEFTQLDKTVAAAIVAGVFTVTATTITVMVGRYFEEKRKQSELHRERKIKMYDAFIERIFNLFTGGDDAENVETEMIDFLRDSQRQFLLWSGPGVIRAYSEWNKALRVGQNAQTVLLMEKFFLAIRHDLGHSNWGVKQGDTIRFVLRHTDFFLEQIKTNPNLTLVELGALEKAEGLEPTGE